MLLNLDIDPANVDVDGIGDALPVTVADPNGIAAALPTGTSWTQAGDAEYITESVNGAKSQHIIVTTAADETTPQSTMTLVGTDRDGAAITEDLTLPNAGTVVTSKQFLTVTGISVDVTTEGVIDVGWLITSWNSDETALWVATSAGDSLAHRLGVTTTGDEPGGGLNPLLTLTGTDADGYAITETVTLPNATLVETVKYFLTVTEASTGPNAVAGVFDIGWVDEVASETFELDSSRNVPSNYQIDITGTINVSLVFTMDNLFTSEQSDIKFVAGDAALTSETMDTAVIVMPSGFTGFRAVVNSYSSGGELQLRATQANLAVAI